MYYGFIGEEYWGFFDFIDQEKVKKVCEDMKECKIIYGDSVSYCYMCCFEFGFFFCQFLMMNYEYYWCVEFLVELFCDIYYDFFCFMYENGKKYSFVFSLYEYIEIIFILWDSVIKFMKNYFEYIVEDNFMGFLSDDGGKMYNKCYFVSGFFVFNLR